MKGGGLTWVGWLAVGVGSMLVYAGMTGQSLVAELAGVLTGKGLVKGAAAPTAGGDGRSGTGGGGTAGGGAGGGGGSSWGNSTAKPKPAGVPYAGGSSATANGLSGFPPGTVFAPPVAPRVPAGAVRYPLVAR